MNQPNEHTIKQLTTIGYKIKEMFPIGELITDHLLSSMQATIDSLVRDTGLRYWTLKAKLNGRDIQIGIYDRRRIDESIYILDPEIPTVETRTTYYVDDVEVPGYDPFEDVLEYDRQ